MHRSGGAVAGGVSNSAGGGKGKGKGAKKRGRENADAESDGESSDEDQSGVVQGGARKARLAVGGADRGFVPEVQACVGLLKACLASVPLGSHQVICGEPRYLDSLSLCLAFFPPLSVETPAKAAATLQTSDKTSLG